MTEGNAPPTPATIEATAANVKAALQRASDGLIDRESLVELIALAAVAREHLLVVGPPGTAKSEAVRRVSNTFGGQYFEYLLGRFTEPNEIFGPIDLRKLRDGIVHTETSGMLPEAEIAFLDEVFRGSTAILNTLLGVLNDRVFTRGHTRADCPLRVCVGASNELPEDETLAAFADRFLLRTFVEPVSDTMLEYLLAGGWSLSAVHAQVTSIEDLDTLAEAARQCDLDGVRPQLAQAIRTLRHSGVQLSDRRSVKLQGLVAAAAVLAGRTAPSTKDLWPIVYAVPTAAEQRIAREVLRPLLDHSDNETLPAAAEDASQGPLARAPRIATAATALLDEEPDDEQRPLWLMKLEGIAREIDATFDLEHLPESLVPIRERITKALNTTVQ